MKITSVFAREILDSRGNPTVEVEVTSEKGFGRAAAPSGASTGIHEAREIRDGGRRFLGKGVLKAVENVNKKIAREIVGKQFENPEEIDKKMIELDGTKNKSKLGANAMVATSMAVFRCAACEQGKTVYEYLGGGKLPIGFFNVLNGGKHAGGKLSIQEFMIVPQGAKTFKQGLQWVCEIYHTLGKRLVKKYGVSARNVGDEGGFAPLMNKSTEALNAIVGAIEETGYGKRIKIALDCAASSFYKNKKYLIDGKRVDSKELEEYYLGLVKKYPIISIEDPFEEEDFEGFARLNKKLKGKVQVVGDDLVVTNITRIKTAIDEKSMSTLLLKINQIGTVSEALEAFKLCKKKEINSMVSHRSGETEDNFISDFVVGIEAGQMKSGAPARGERTSKYNQLLRIEENLNR